MSILSLWSIGGLIPLLSVASPAAPAGPDAATATTPAQDSVPIARAHHALVYDPAGRRVILAGGSGALPGNRYEVLDDVWSFDGATWTLLGASGRKSSGQSLAADGRGNVLSLGGWNEDALPGLFRLEGHTWVERPAPPDRPVEGGGFVYDSGRDRWIAFGGSAARDRSWSDTWEYDGATWTRTTDTGPGARGGFATVYDTRRGKTVLFGGGVPGRQLDDTWEYDGRRWTQATAAGPSARLAPAFAYDEARGMLVVFGGAGPDGVYGDTWGWDGSRWTLLAESGPPARVLGTMAYDSTRRRIVLFGGRTDRSGDLNDTWEWDGSAWARVGGAPAAAQTGAVPSAPGVRAHHTLVWDPTSRRVLLNGGSTPLEGGNRFEMYDDVWAFDASSWTLVGHTGRRSSGQRLASDGRRTVLSFGGWNGESLPGLFRLEGATLVELAPLDRPTAEGGFVYDAARDRWVVFGGSAGRDQNHGDTWEFDGSAWTRMDVPGPAPRQGHAMVYDTRRRKTVVFGGSGEEQYGDTWEYDGASWTRVATDGPSPRISPGFTYDEARGVMLVFGGVNADGVLGDTWAWDGRAWTRVAEAGPGPRIMGMMAYDPVRRRVVLFGGRLGWPNDVNDTWEWDGTSWTRVGG